MKARWLSAAFVAAMLLALVGQALWAAFTNSVATDEPAYIASGLAIVRTGDFRLAYQQGPLMDILCGVATAHVAPPLPLDAPEWRIPSPYPFGVRFWSTLSPGDAARVLFAARLPALGISVALALLVLVWARQLYGWPAAGLALGLYCFEPNLLAFSSLAGNDLAIVAGIAFCLYAWWRYLRSRSSGWLALTGLALGVALLIKQSALLLVILLPLLAALDAAAVRRAGDSPLVPGRYLAGRMVIVLVVAAVVVWAGFGFQTQTVGYANWPVDQRPPGALRLPAGQFINGLISQTWHQRLGHPAYLLGQTYERGRWYYFPVALAVKTPLPLLALIAAAFALRRFRRDELFLALPAAAFFLAAMSQRVNIGVRYVLIVYPLLIAFAARVAAWRWPARRPPLDLARDGPVQHGRGDPAPRDPEGPSGSRRKRSEGPRAGWAAVGALAAWMVVEALLYAPQYLPYFNELAGGPAGGDRILADSNMDWGQDLKRLAAWQRRHPVQPLYLAYSGSGDPLHFGIRAIPLPGYAPLWPRAPMPPEWYRAESRPRSGWIAVSVNCLRLDLKSLTDRDISYAWLQRYKPVAHAGYSIQIYHIPG